MKHHHLLFGLLLLAYMHAFAQTDTTASENALPAWIEKEQAIKFRTDFSYHTFRAFRLTDTSNKLYLLPNYKPMFHYDKHRKGQNALQMAGRTLISIFAQNNQHMYNYGQPK
jgi:hypothetical protein